MEPKILLGTVPAEVRDFSLRNRLFSERFENVKAALGVAFKRTLESPSIVDRVVFYLGRLCVEDFNEILVLAANGYGLGAVKLIRGLFEKVVTAFFLHLNPEHAQDFLDFYWISQRKEVNNLRDAFGPEAVQNIPVAEIEENYKKVAARFEVTACPKCRTKRINYTWSKLDLIAMAKEVQKKGKLNLGNFVFEAYLRPLRYAHSTAAGILARLQETDNETITFDYKFQRSEADDALKTAHRLLTLVVLLQAVHFQLDNLKELLDKLIADFTEIWPDSGQRSNSE